MAESNQVTRLLVKWGNGSQDAQEELLPIVYDELRKMAKRYLRGERKGHTFQTTELIHEAYLKLAADYDRDWKNRNHFFGVAANAMRQILVDYARAKSRTKRGGGARKVELEDSAYVSGERSEELIRLDDALGELAQFDLRKSKVVELKYFGGLTVPEIADFLSVSPNTVKRDWQFSRAWLMRRLAAS